MHWMAGALLIAVSCSGAAAAQQGAAAAQQSAAAQQGRAARPSHPEEVALVDEGERGSVYRRFPGGQRLYTYDRDRPGRSNCDQGCVGGWLPVPAPADAVNVGRWSVVVRRDGSRQWALDGRPVYTRFHDAPDQPMGDGFHGVWRLVPYMPQVPVPPR